MASSTREITSTTLPETSFEARGLATDISDRKVRVRYERIRLNTTTATYTFEIEIVVLLKARGFSTGLAKALALNTEVFEQRYWVVDNSGSMEVEDGHRIVNMAKKYVVQSVSRWEELQDTIGYHSEMAALLQTPTTFKLLNRPAPGVGKREFSVAKKGTNVEDDIRKAKEIMGRAKPLGVTPLTQRVWEIRDSIKASAPHLITEGRRVVVVLATDGLPTDEEGYGGEDALEEFTDALKSLEGLPLWLVIRLCTDEVKVTKFYNTLDSKLDLPLEVLDDFLGEAAEVHRHNNWLNYALPIHRCRELGHHDRLFDVIDERPLTKFELREFCALLFGTEIRQIPDPNVNWKDFLMYIQDELKEETKQWDPVQKKVGPWIYLKSLHRRYGNGVCSIM
jgi:hypothetical protein